MTVPRVAGLALALWLVTAQAAEPAWPGNGPLWCPNSHPFHTIFLDQPLLDPVLPRRPCFEVHVTEANTLAYSSNVTGSPAWYALQSNLNQGRPQQPLDAAMMRDWAAAHPSNTYLFADTETTRLSLAATVPIGRRWGVRAELPLQAHWGGLLDEVIKGWHRLLNFPDLGRSYTPSGHAQILVARGDQSRYFDGSSALDLGDLVVRGLYAARRETHGGPAVMVAGSLKAPTGAVSRFAGSGNWEGGLSVNAAKSWGDFRTYLGAGYTWHSAWKGLSRVPIANTLDLHAGLEMRVDRHWSWQVQFSREEQALAKAEPGSFGGAAWRLAGAAHYRLGPDAVLDWSFTENLTENANTEDLSIQTGLRWSMF